MSAASSARAEIDQHLSSIGDILSWMVQAPHCVLLISTDCQYAESLGEHITRTGARTVYCRSPTESAEWTERECFSTIVLVVPAATRDVSMLVGEVNAKAPDATILVVTEELAGIQVDSAVKPLVFRWFEKSLEFDHLRTIAEAAATSVPEDETSVGRKLLIGKSSGLRQALERVSIVGPSNATVLILGETGTGKEMIARLLHEKSPRRSGPFVKAVCASMPDPLLESELFGYEKGAFTGAAARKYGRVDLAKGGTLFLDEVGEIGLPTQVKLLQLLQDRVYMRLGGTKDLPADVRIVAATNCDLKVMVSEKRFREDLYHRLKVVPIWLPPLRTRRDDIPELARHFVRSLCGRGGRTEPWIDPKVFELLQAQSWPGNVRELENFIECLVTLNTGPTIHAEDVVRELQERASQESPGSFEAPRENSQVSSVVGPLDEKIRKAELRALERALKCTQGNCAKAANLLGISRRSLYAKMQDHGLQPQKWREKCSKYPA